MAKFERATAIFEVDGKRYQLGLKQLEKRQSAFAASTKRIFGGLKSLAGLGGIGAAIGGGFALGKVAGDVLDFETALTRFGIAAGFGADEVREFRSRINETSRETGVARAELLKGANAFFALTGDARGAADQMETFGRVNIATGATMEDISAVAAALSQQLKIGAPDMERAFSILARGGKEGAVEFREMASLMASLSAQFKQFAGSTGPEGLARLGAAFQIARRNFGSASEAATGLERLLESFGSARTAKALKGAGIDVFTQGKDGVKRLRSFADIIDEIGRSKLAKDSTLLGKAFESAPARNALRALMDYGAEWDEIADSTLHAKDVATDYDAFQQSSAGQIARAIEQVKLRIAETFTPERIQKFAEAMQAVVLMVSDLVDGLEKAGRFIERFGETGKEARNREFGSPAAVADDLVARGITEDQLERPWELPEEVQHAIQGREIDVRNEMARARRRAQVFEQGDQFRSDVEAAGQPAFDSEEEARQNEPTWRRTKVRSRMDVHVSVDRDANLKATVDNHRSQRQ